MERQRHTTAAEALIRANALFEWLPGILDRLFHDETAQKMLTEKLAQVHPGIRWEVGPFQEGKSFFVFSPNLDVKLLPATETLARSAPEVPGWVFLPAKPRKMWTSRSIEIAEGKGEVVRYNFDRWLYYLTSFKDGEFFDVNLVPCGYEDKPLDDLQYAGSLFVEFELGERMFMEFVDRINIVPPSELAEFGNKIEHLHDQIMQQLEKKVRQ
jgi:hypothetical protein